MNDLPPRLLDAGQGPLATRLLRSAAIDAPRAGSLARALAAAATASTTAAAAGAAGAGLTKTIATWLLIGGIGGGVASGTAFVVSSNVDKPASSASSLPPSIERVGPAPRAVATSALSPERALEKHMEAPAPPKASEPLEVPGVSGSTARGSPSEARRASPVSARGQAVALTRTPPSPLGVSGVEGGGATAGAASRAASAANVAEELVLIDAARRSLSSGDLGGALALLARYRKSFPAGHFAPEALALEIEAHMRRGETPEARRLAARFFASYPAHPLAARVRAQLTNR